MARRRSLCVFLLIMAMLPLGCSDRGSPAAVHGLTSTASLSHTATPRPTITGTATPSRAPSATWTATATATATPTATPTPSATPTRPHPMDIAWMRAQTYPGSHLVVEEVLDPGGNYDRLIVSYLSDGLRIEAYMTVPQGEQPDTGWPVVMFNHEYIPPDQYRSTERYVAYVDAYARRGYIVFRSDYRGHGDSEGRPSGGALSPDYTVDVLNGMASVMGYPATDPDRVGMWGHSMGGGITLRAMVVSPDIKAGVIWAGMVAKLPDMLSFYARRLGPTPGVDSSDAEVGLAWGAGRLGVYERLVDDTAFWEAISPNSFVGDLSGPVSIHHGTGDAVVPLWYSLDLAEQIEAAGRPVELHTYVGDDHNIAGNWGTAMTLSLAFMDEHVKNALR